MVIGFFRAQPNKKRRIGTPSGEHLSDIGPKNIGRTTAFCRLRKWSRRGSPGRSKATPHLPTGDARPVTTRPENGGELRGPAGAGFSTTRRRRRPPPPSNHSHGGGHTVRSSLGGTGPENLGATGDTQESRQPNSLPGPSPGRQNGQERRG